MSLKQHGHFATNGFMFPLFRQMLQSVKIYIYIYIYMCVCVCVVRVVVVVRDGLVIFDKLTREHPILCQWIFRTFRTEQYQLSISCYVYCGAIVIVSIHAELLQYSPYFVFHQVSIFLRYVFQHNILSLKIQLTYTFRPVSYNHNWLKYVYLWAWCSIYFYT